ncbi:MAG TPA: lipoprotein [Ramlibacter sp.]|nr:lipoprotein [Ramlibacter sp.]
MKQILLLITLAAALAACTEQTQTINNAKRPDAAAFQGTGTPFAAPGWKPGDRISWEQHLKTRTQNGQNDYAKVN